MVVRATYTENGWDVVQPAAINDHLDQNFDVTVKNRSGYHAQAALLN